MKRILHGRAAIAWWIFGRGLIGLLLAAFLLAGLLAVVEHCRGRHALNAVLAEMKEKDGSAVAAPLLPELSDADRATLKKLVSQWNHQEKEWPFLWNSPYGFPDGKTRQAASLTDPLPPGYVRWKDKARLADPVAWADIEAALAPMRPSLDLFRLEALSFCLNGRKLAYGYSGYLTSLLYAQTLSDLRGNRLDRLPTAILLSLGLKEGDAMALTWEALQRDGWTDDGLAGLAASWSGVVPLDQIGDNLQRMRLMMADYKGNAGPLWLGNDDIGLACLGRVVIFAFNDLVRARSLRSIQDSLDALQRMKKGEPYPAVASWLDERRKSQASIRGPFSWLEAKMGETPFSSSAWMKVALRRQAAFDEARTAIALARYRVQNGKYPAALPALVPQFLPAVPKSLFDGKPLSYHPWDDGTFTLEAVFPKAAGFSASDSPVWPRRVP